MARDHLRVGAVRLVLVGGLPGTGKSTLAAALGDAREVTVLRSDEIRKELAGLAPHQPAPAAFGESIYEPGLTHGTYNTMVRRARVALALGETVVLDASWADQAWRDEARTVASACEADAVELQCVAPAALAAQRMRARAASGADPSDPTPEIAAVMADRQAPWPTATVIDTAGTPEAAAEAALAAFDAVVS